MLEYRPQTFQVRTQSGDPSSSDLTDATPRGDVFGGLHPPVQSLLGRPNLSLGRRDPACCCGGTASERAYAQDDFATGKQRDTRRDSDSGCACEQLPIGGVSQRIVCEPDLVQRPVGRRNDSTIVPVATDFAVEPGRVAVDSVRRSHAIFELRAGETSLRLPGKHIRYALINRSETALITRLSMGSYPSLNMVITSDTPVLCRDLNTCPAVSRQDGKKRGERSPPYHDPRPAATVRGSSR